MSTCYATVGGTIPFEALLAACPELGIDLPENEGNGPKDRFLAYDDTGIFAYTGDGSDTGFTSHGVGPSPAPLLELIAVHFGVRIVSEYDPEFPWPEDMDDE